MGYRELFLVLASVILLTLLMTQINSNTVEGREAMQQLEFEHTAAAIAQQFIEEAKSKKFDAQIGMVDAADPDNFTPWNNLGAGGWENYPNFNDVDDYHNFSRTVYVNGENFEADSTVTDGIPFNVSIQVQYVSVDNPDSVITDESHFKRMTVTVTSNYIPSSIVVKHVFSYYGVNL
jgi:hypothetical protein